MFITMDSEMAAEMSEGPREGKELRTNPGHRPMLQGQ